jgi:signal transduction histidine kinase
MQETNLLHTIRPIWLHRVTLQMAKGVGLRENLRSELEHFFSLLEQATETGDPAWMDSILKIWAESLTQSDLEEPASSLIPFINQLFSLTFQVCRETLDEIQTVEILDSLIPCFSYCYEKSAQYEIQARMDYVFIQLDETKQALERLDRNKSDFIAVAAHELKTPLTLIEGYTSMLNESQVKSPIDSANVMLIHGIRNGTRRLRSIIDDMIDVSLIDNNLMAMNLQPIWLNRIFDVLASELKASLGERNQTLTIVPFPGSDEMNFGDPERLLQVFRNILSNAVKFTPDGGSITITGRKLPGFIETTITDTGIGIAPEDVAIIFDKLTHIGSIQLHSSGKTKFKGGGPGLGLHIARGIVEAHSGSIWAESPGRDEEACPGSTFHIILPIRTQAIDEKMAKLFEPLSPNPGNPLE